MTDVGPAEPVVDLGSDVGHDAGAGAGTDFGGDRRSDRDAGSDPGAQPAAFGGGLGLNLSFRTRLTIGLIAASLIPLAGFGSIVLILGSPDQNGTIGRLLLFVLVMAAMIAILLAWLLAADLTAPLRAIAAAVDRASAGDLSTPIVVPGEDELARLADSHNRLAADLERRNRELGRILAAIENGTPRDSVDFICGRAGNDARAAFGMIDATVILIDPRQIALEERVPGEPLPVRASLRIGGEEIGLLVGHLPATRLWERADQDLLELFASEIAVAIRNAQLFARVESQNSQLLELDAAKDDFLRGVSHNLQTPLTSIRAYADQLDRDRPDRRLGIIAEQTDRLSRMVRQLLTVTRLESGALKPRSEVVALAHPVSPSLGGAGRRGRLVRGRGRLGRLARGGRRRSARPGPLGAARQRPQVRRADADHGRDRARPGPGAPAAHDQRSGSRGRGHGSGAPVPALRARRGSDGRRRQRPRPVRLPRAVPGDGRRPRPRSRRSPAAARRSASSCRGSHPRSADPPR